MVIVKLMGGLGNQMFQYAAGRVLAEKHKVPLKLDVTFLNDRSARENFTFRDFELDCFNYDFEIASHKEIEKFNLLGNLGNLFRRLTRKKSFFHFCEQSFNYNEGFEQLPSDVFLEGYWQSEKYFQHIRTLLMQVYTWKPISDENNLSILNSIKMNNSVSVHIRRGDYIENEFINKFHGICDKDYYTRAISYMNEHLENPVFYFFSDDVQWVKKEFEGLGAFVFIDYNIGIHSNKDIYLMSNCKHNIIANSSFSWWGAWLNQNVNKIVVAPEKWFKKADINTSDLIPSQWINI